MYIIVITCHPGGLHRCDPFVIGKKRLTKESGYVASIFETETAAEKFLEEYQSKWTDRDWDDYEGHVIEFNA